MSHVPSFFGAAVPHKALKEDTFQRQVLIFNFAFESAADPPCDFSDSVSAAASLLSCTCREMESPAMGSALSTRGVTFQKWVSPVNLRFKALIVMLMISECTGSMNETQIYN